MSGAPNRRRAAGGLPGTWGARLLAIAFWLLVWQLVATAIGSRIVLVGPVEVLARLAELAGTGEFWRSVATSLGRIALGFVAGALSGVALAPAARCSRVARELLAPVMGALKAVPVASFVILVLMWVPSSELSVVIAWIMTMPIVYTNVLEGIEQTDPGLLEMARVFGIGPVQRIRLVYVTQVLPYLRAALSLALGLTWKAGVAAEVIGLPDLTIGEHLYEAKVYLDTPSLFAWTVAIVVLSVGLETLARRALDAALRRWEARP